jgi:hypothetical protein
MGVIGVSKTSDACGSKKYASRTFVSVCASGLPEEGIWYDAAPRPARLAVHRETVHGLAAVEHMLDLLSHDLAAAGQATIDLIAGHV